MDYRNQMEAKQAAAQQQYNPLSGGTTAPQYGGMIGSAGLAPTEPGAADKARETLNYIRELEQLQRELRMRLYGPFPESAENGLKNPQEPCLDDMLRDICQRTAMAVGELKSILARL